MMVLYESPCYCTNLRRSTHKITQLYDAALEPTGVTAAQYYLLINLQRLGAANISHWAQRVGLDRSTMVRNIALLLKRDLIRQVAGHGKTYALTATGTAVMADAQAAWEKTQQEIREYLGAEDVDALLRVSRKLQAWEQSDYKEAVL